MTQLHICLLGPFEVWRDGQLLPPDAWPSRKTCQLFKVLVTHRQRTVSGDELLDWLWPDLSLASARNSLWVAVSHLRRVLEPDIARRAASTFVLTEPTGYRFDPAGRCQIDVDVFLNQVRIGQDQQRQGEWMTALAAYLAAQALYRGDYLAEDPYEDWALPTQEQVRETFLELQTALATCRLALGHYRESLVHARLVLEPRDLPRERLAAGHGSPQSPGRAGPGIARL
jgi:DNA-binding SARP family transcriptional activator